MVAKEKLLGVNVNHFIQKFDEYDEEEKWKTSFPDDNIHFVAKGVWNTNEDDPP